MHEPLTAVWQDCEFCGKFTFAFRKKFYLQQKINGYEVRNLAKRRNVSGHAKDYGRIQ